MPNFENTTRFILLIIAASVLLKVVVVYQTTGDLLMAGMTFSAAILAWSGGMFYMLHRTLFE